MKLRRKTLSLFGLVGLVSCATLSAHADVKGERILREAFRKLRQAQSMTAELLIERRITGQPAMTGKGTIFLKKPNLLKITLSNQSGSRTMTTTYVSNGKFYYSHSQGAKNYMRQPTEKRPTEFGGDWEGEVDAFFGGEANVEKVIADFDKTETVDGVLCDVLRVTVRRQGDNRVLTYAIGQRDRLIHRTTWTMQLNDQMTLTHINRVRNVKLNGAVSASQFAFVPPKGVTLYDSKTAMRELEAKLVAVGKEAPAFELTDPQSKERFSLAKALDGRKAVLVNFWFYG